MRLELLVHNMLLLFHVAAATGFGATAFLTREQDANGQLQDQLNRRGIPTEELPCVATQRLEGYDHLCNTLSNGGDDWDSRALLPKLHPWIIVASPEGAVLFAEAWAHSRDPTASKPKIAAIGVGTAEILAAAMLPADFTPSVATCKALAAELPLEADVGAGSVLYPACDLVADTVADGLAARGLRMRRINTYTTVPAEWSAEDLKRAQRARVVTFDSPLAARVWSERAGTAAAAICIGEASAAEARSCGFERVRLFPRDQ